MGIPSSFVGNGPIVERLRTKLREERLPHALIFSGPEGVGKHTFALQMAQALNCTGNDRPCGICGPCRKIQRGSHPDVTVLGVEAGASQIKIEQIRKVRSMLQVEPLEGLAKIFLIDPAERMTPGAGNALLKALEEPPPKTHFFLITTNVHALLITIRSRSQTYHFSPVPLDEIRRSGIENELVVRWSQGSIGRALATDPEELVENRDMLLGFLETALTVRDEDLVELLSASAELARSKDDYRERIRILGVLISDLMFLKEGIAERLVNVDVQERLNALQARVSLERIVQIGVFIKFIEANLKYYLNRQMMADMLLLTMNESTAEILNDKPWEYR